jgi:hypothetical protein
LPLSATISVAAGAKLTQGRPLNDPVLPENLIRETRGRAYGNEAADDRFSNPVAACYPVAIYEASAA